MIIIDEGAEACRIYVYPAAERSQLRLYGSLLLAGLNAAMADGPFLDTDEAADPVQGSMHRKTDQIRTFHLSFLHY